MPSPAARIRRAREPGLLQMAQILVHSRRPQPHRPQQPITAPNDPASHAPAWDRHLACPGMLVTGHQASMTSNAGPPERLPARWAASPPGETIARAAGDTGEDHASACGFAYRKRGPQPLAALAGHRGALRSGARITIAKRWLQSVIDCRGQSAHTPAVLARRRLFGVGDRGAQICAFCGCGQRASSPGMADALGRGADDQGGNHGGQGDQQVQRIAADRVVDGSDVITGQVTGRRPDPGP